MSVKGREMLVVAAVHLALAVIISLPLALNFNSGIPYAHRVDPGWETVHMQQGDHLQFFYTLSLFGDYARNKTAPFFAEPYTFRTLETQKYFAPRELPLSIVHFLISPLGNIIAYNLLTVLSFIACGIGMFLLAGRYVKSFGGRLFASVVYSVFPFRMAQLFGGHPNGMLIFLIPFMVYGYERWFEEGRLKHLLLAAVCLISMTMEELHLGYFSALFTAAFVAYKAAGILSGADAKQKLKKTKRFISSAAGVLIAWMFAGGYIAYLRNVVFKIAEVAEGRELWEIGIYAPRLADFINRASSDAEKVIYPGAAVILVAAAAFIRKKRGSAPVAGKAIPWFYLFIFVITALLSFGPNLRGVPVYSFFYNHVPFFHYPRSTARIFVFSMLALCVLSAYGFERIQFLIKSKSLSRILAPGLILLALFDYQSFRSIGVSTLERESPVYEYAAGAEDPGFLLEVPLWPGDSSWSSVYLYYNTLYRIPMVNGYSPFVAREYIEGVFWPLASVNMGVLNRGQHSRLKELGVRFIILHEEAYPSRVSPFPFRMAVNNMKNNPLLEFVKQDGPLYLFSVREEVEEGADFLFSMPSVNGVFYEAEHLYSQMADPEFDEQASGGFARFAGSGDDEREFVLFGPYQLFPPGRYRVIFRLKGENAEPGEVFAHMDVAGAQGAKIFAEKILMGDDVAPHGYSDYELNFSIEELQVLEFRLRWFGSGRIWADYVYLTFKETSDPVYFYNTSDMFNSRGDYAYGLKGVHPPHNIAQGGARRYEAGDYTAHFRIKISEPARGAAARLRVVHAGTGAIFAEKSVKGNSSGLSGGYEDIPVGFSLSKEEVLNFEIFFTGKADLWAESITITPAGAGPPKDYPGRYAAAELLPGLLEKRYPGAAFGGTPSVEAVRLCSLSPGGSASGARSIAWEGFFEAEEGLHSAGVLSGGITRVYIGGEEVFSAGRIGHESYHQESFHLTEGPRHIRVEHSIAPEGNIFRMYWKTPSMDSPVPLPLKPGFFSYLPEGAAN